MSPDTSQDIVTAVIVAHDGAAWIAGVAHAVASQTRPVQRVVAVDSGSRDRSGAMLTQAFGRGAVFGMDRTVGYGAAVAQALRHRAANTGVSHAAPGREERTEWVWLIHDDCEPAADALERLLAGSKQAPACAVLGPKVRDWADRRVLLEAGITTDRACRRITGIEPREVDQGQHDGDRDVVAVSSAGMLVRRDVWDQVGGFDPGMRLFRDDIDFCWRVQAAGYRVRLITDAVVYHVEASARNRRPVSAAPHRRREERRNGLLALLANLPAGPMLSALAGNVVLSTLRALFFLLAKRPAAALDEAAAVTSVAFHPRRLREARRRRARGRKAAYSRLRPELPPGRSLRKLAEFAAGALSRTLPADTVGSHHAASEDPSDDDSMLVDSGLAQRLLTSPGVLLFLALTVIALVAARSLLRSGVLGGGALVPAWGGSSALWQEYVQGFHPVGLGTAAGTPPYVAVIALVATVLGGKPWLAVDVILLGCVPLAGVTAFAAVGRVTRWVPARVWAALTYALLPVGMGAVAAGRLGTAVVLVVAPVAVLLAGRSLTGPRRRARRAAWSAALLVAVAAAFVPLVLLVTAAAMAAGAAAFRYRRGTAGNAAIVVLVPPLLLMPWTIDLFTRPGRLFLEAGLTVPGLASPKLPARTLLLLSPGGPGLPPYWVTAGLAFAAAAALVISRRRIAVYAGWALAVIGMIAAASVSRVAVRPLGSAAPVPAWPGPALAITGAGLLLAAAAAADGLPARLRSRRWRTLPGLAALAVAAVACSAPALAAAHWVVSGVNGPVAPVAGPLLPEFVSVSAGAGAQVRTLVLRPGPRGSITYAVLRGTDPLIGSAELAMPTAGQRALDLAVATLTAPAGSYVQDQGRSLAGFGIGYVMLPYPVDHGLAMLLDGVPGLRQVSSTPAFELWRVVDTTGRVTVTEPGGRIVALQAGPVSVSGVAAPPAGGTLVLAEPAGGWHATLDGRPLTPLRSPVGGWAQGFRLPPGGGSLSIGRSQIGRTIAVAAECAAVLLVIVLGLPGARDGAEAEETSAAPVRGRGAGVQGSGSGDRPPARGGRVRGRRAARRGGEAPDGTLPGAVSAGASRGWAVPDAEERETVMHAARAGAREAPGMLDGPAVPGAPGRWDEPGLREVPGGWDPAGVRGGDGGAGGRRVPATMTQGYPGPRGGTGPGNGTGAGAGHDADAGEDRGYGDRAAGRWAEGSGPPVSRHRHRRAGGRAASGRTVPDPGRHEQPRPGEPGR